MAFTHSFDLRSIRVASELFGEERDDIWLASGTL
jgi:hypothetical protein